MNTKNQFARKLLPPWLNNLGGWIFIFSALYFLVYLSWTFFRWGGEENIALIGNLFYISFDLAIVVVLLWVATRPDLSQGRRRAWWLFGLATFSYYAADLSWAYIESVLGEPPFPSVADIFYLGFIPFALGGVLNLADPMQFRRKYDRQRYWLDLAIAALASLILVWYFVIADTLAESAGDLTTAIFAAAYPIGDLILITGALAVLFRRPESTTRSVLKWVFLALLLFVGADLAYAYQSLQGTYFTGGWLDICWPLAFLFMQVAALRQLDKTPEKELTERSHRLEQLGRWAVSGLVIFALGLVLYLGLVIGFGSDEVSWLTVGALLIVGLVGWRFFGTRGFADLSLRNKFVASFLIITLVPLAGLAYYNDLTTRQLLTDNANTVLRGSAAQTAASLDEFLNDGLNNVRTASQSYVWQEFLALAPSERAGSELEYKTNIDLRALARRDPIFITSVSLLDQRGKIVADTVPSELGEDNSDFVYFTQPRDTGSSYVSPVMFDDDNLTIHFSAPVRDTNGDLIGVLRIRYNAEVLQQIITQSAATSGLDGIEFILLEENHIRLAVSEDSSLILKSVAPLSPDQVARLQAERRLPEGQPAEELYTNLLEFEEGLSNFANQPIFTGEIHPEEDETEYTSEQIAVANLDTQPWLLAAAQEQDVYLAPVEAQTRTAGVIVLFVALIVVLAAMAIARVLSNPVVQLRNVVNQIASGDLQAQVPIGSRDEIGQLAIAFNEMAKQLRETLGTIQRRASELATVARVSTVATQTTDTATLLQQVVDQTKSAFNLYHTHIYLFNEAGDTLVLTAGAGEVGKQMVAEKRTIPLDREQSLVARAARTRQGVIVNDVQADTGFLPHPLLPGTRSEMAIPLIVGDEVLGVFDIQSEITNRFTDQDVSIQTTLASQVAVALQNTRQYEESLRFKLGIENSGDAVFATDVNGKITYVNTAFEKVYGYSRDEAIGKNPRIIKSGLLNQEIYKQFWAGLLSKNPVSGEIINKHKDGHLIYIAGTNSAIVNDAGEIIGFLAVHHDITEQRKNQDLITQRARQQESLNLITQKIQSTTSVEAALQIAVRELGRATGTQTSVNLELQATKFPMTVIHQEKPNRPNEYKSEEA